LRRFTACGGTGGSHLPSLFKPSACGLPLFATFLPPYSVPLRRRKSTSLANVLFGPWLPFSLLPTWRGCPQVDGVLLLLSSVLVRLVAVGAGTRADGSWLAWVVRWDRRLNASSLSTPLYAAILARMEEHFSRCLIPRHVWTLRQTMARCLFSGHGGIPFTAALNVLSALCLSLSRR